MYFGVSLLYCLNFSDLSINSSFSFSIISFFFFQIHLLKRSASQRLNHAIYCTININCSWYTAIQLLTSRIGAKSSSNFLFSSAISSSEYQAFFKISTRLSAIYLSSSLQYFLSIYDGIYARGHGRYKETIAIKSSKLSGHKSIKYFLIQSDSN
jgi:hypothetical protein